MRFVVTSKGETAASYVVRLDNRDEENRYRISGIDGVTVQLKRDARFGALSKLDKGATREELLSEQEATKKANRDWFNAIEIGDEWELKPVSK